MLLGSAGLGWRGAGPARPQERRPSWARLTRRQGGPAGGRKAMGRNEKEEGRVMKKPFSFYF